MISIIVAIAKNGIIGGENNLLWHIREDLQRFKQITTGHPVVMGRKTFESIGKPLPNRTNVIITRQRDYEADGCIVVHSLNEARAITSEKKEEIFIIGGGEIYRQAWDLAEKLYITWIHATFDGDTFLPDDYVQKLINLDKKAKTESGGKNDQKLGLWKWNVLKRERHERGEKFEHPFEFVDYQRVQMEIPFP